MKKRGSVLSEVTRILPLVAVLLVAQRLDIVGANQCLVIFKNGHYSITQAVLDRVGGNIQSIVDCVPANRVLKLGSKLNIKPTSTVTLKKPIKLTSAGRGDERPVFECPDGGGKPLFKISATGVVLQDLIISDCATNSNVTAAVVVDIPKLDGSYVGSLNISGVDFVDNTNVNGSGSIYIKSADFLSLKQVKFSRNKGALGGGVFLDSAGVEVDVRDCAFEDNRSILFDSELRGRGAALFQNSSATVTITGSRFSNNYAESAGGALFILGEPPSSKLAIIDTSFLNNTAGSLEVLTDKDGGAIWAQGPALHLDVFNCSFVENKAIAQGGAIFLLGSRRVGEVQANIEDTVFERNVALVGGAIWVQAIARQKKRLNISRSAFVSNEALLQNVGPGSLFENAVNFPFVSPGTGGAIVCIGIYVDVNFTGNIFENNRAIGLGGAGQNGPKGGAILMMDVGNVTMTHTVFRNNSAINLGILGKEASGGALHFTGAGVKDSIILGSPPGSPCSAQCIQDSKALEDKGFKTSVAGCVVLGTDQRRACFLANATVCEGVLPVENIITFKDEPELGATCEVIVRSSNIQLVNTKFEDNLVDGPGGAIFLGERRAILTLGDGVELIGNTARNSRGAALAVSNGATLIVEGDIKVANNSAGIGEVFQGAFANLNIRGKSFIQDETTGSSNGGADD